MATIYYRTALTGGAATALDEADGTALTDGDMAIVQYSGDFYFYLLDDDSAAAESSPSVISPDDNAGDKRWILQNAYSVTAGVNPPAGVSITGNVAGMVMSNAADTEHDISFSAGACMDSTGAYHILNSAAMVKRIDAAWAAESTNGGLLNGSVAANELYHCYALRKDADGTADFGFLDQDDAIGDYLPAGYTYYRWIGFVDTDASSNIRNFLMIGNDIIFNTAFEILTNVNTASLTSQSIAGYIPAGNTETVTIGGNDGAGAVGIGTTSSEAETYILSVAGTTWLSIVEGDSAANSICTVHPTLAGAIYIFTNSVSVDIWLKAVKIIR